MRNIFSYKLKAKGLILLGLILGAHLTCSAQGKVSAAPGADTISVTKQKAVDTTIKTTVALTKDTTIQKIIAGKDSVIFKLDTTNILTRKGTKRRPINDDVMDIITQKVIETSDQYQDVTNITIQPKLVNAEVTNKAPNTEATPAASTAVINTLDGNPGFATNKENNNTIKNGSDGVRARSGVQNQMSTQLNSLYTTTLLKDSLMANSNKDFLFNNVTITNTSSAKVTLLVTINIPNTWSLITDKVLTITLEPNGSQVIPMRLLPTNSSTAAWEQVTLEYRNTETGDTRRDFFNVRVQEFTKFKARLLNPTMVLLAYQKLLSIPIYLRNSGNVTGTYTIASANEFLHLDDKMSINLDGGRDTTYNLSLALTENEYKMLTKQDIRIIVSSKEDAYNLVQSLSKVGYILKDHPSAYMDMPLQIEAGMVSQGSSANQYYAGIYGSVDVDKDNRVAIAYRSNTMSRDQTIDNGLVRMDYSGKHVMASIGNIMEMTDFMMDGYGAKGGYIWGKDNDNKAVIYGMLKSRVGNSQVFGGNAQLKLANNIRLTESISANTDKVTKLNSSIARQTLDMKMLDDKLKLSLVAGAGMEQNTAKMLAGQQSEMLGSSFGYNLQFLSKHFSTISNILYNSNSFAGIYKGQRLQSHDARFMMNKFFVGGYYEYNYKSQNVFDDSVMLSDVFAIRSQNYGGRIGYSNKFANMILSAGDQQQLQSGEGNNFTSDYKYLNLNATFSITKKIYLNVNSYTGNMSTDNNKVNNLFVSSTTGTLNAYNGGIAFRYDHGPFYYSDVAAYILNPVTFNRTLVSPYVDVQMFKEQLGVRAQYNYSQSSDIGATQNVMVNLSYSSPTGRYDVHLTGSMPVQSQSGAGNNNYLSASLRMRLDVPCVFIRKYYTAKIVLYKDVNNNGRKDDGEDGIEGQTVSVNGNLFVSDNTGILIYENTSKGTFKADFGFSSKVRGWAPKDGAIQTFEVHGNTWLYVPYRKSKVLAGKLNVIIDSSSNVRFDPSNVKVMATSDDNVTFSTLTDANGEFFFNVPDGHYTVTLSPAAFDDKFKPTQFSQLADMTIDQNRMLYFEIRQKKRTINIHRD